ncbi:MAG TPA: ATP-binding protein [Bacteroidales bacterium]
MHVDSLIIEDFPVVHPYTGVNVIENILLDKKYIVVRDEQNRFYGILTPFDIIERPHKIVFDCLGKTEKVDASDTIKLAYQKMVNAQRHVLPVFQDDNFLGIVHIQNIVNSLSNKTDSAVNKLEETQKELEEEKAKSQIAEKLKEAFLQNISHELRTPLNGLIGFAEVISSSRFDDYQKKEFYKFVTECSQRFLDTVNEIIEISRIQSGDVQYQKNCICSATILVDELSQYYRNEKIALHKSHIEIRASKENNDITFISDLSKIKQILSYIIHNAIKFIENGYVEIGFESNSEHIVFFVKDTGPGIPLDKQDKIFIAFEKLESERHSVLPGVGLGLTIAKYLANSLDGDVWFDSVPGVGSTFYIKFPV